jgi:dihydroorotate dehydrogenase/NAD-dependent dihydropyrimidine dehydrogenase PreA subunit
MKFSISFAGNHLKNPILISSGPLTSSLDLLKRAEDSGAAGASLKLTFPEVPFPGELRSCSLPGRGLIFGTDHRLNRDEGLEVMRRGKEETSLFLMANISCPASDIRGWTTLAREFEQAGADAIEANMTCTHIGHPAELMGQKEREELKCGAQIGQNPELCRLITQELKKALRISVVPKPFSNHPRFLEVVRAIEEGGANGVSISSVLSNCLPAPDIYKKGKPDISLLDKVSAGIVSGNPLAKHMGFGKISQIRKNSRLPVISSGGISKWQDIIETIMWGATAVGLCTHIMWYGFAAIPKILKGLGRYMEEEQIESLDSVCGLALPYVTTPDLLEIIRGTAQIDAAACNGCGVCLNPGHCTAIVLEEGKSRVIESRCIGCSVCVSLCPKKAIRMERMRSK